MIKRRVSIVAVLGVIIILSLAVFAAWWMLNKYDYKQNCGNDSECLYKAYSNNCATANASISELTIEGDAIITSINLERDSDGGCSVGVVIDGSKDRYGDGKVYTYVCKELVRNGDRLDAERCDGQDNKKIELSF